MSKKIVIKFGGSNFKSKESVSQIIKAIKLYKQPLVIVVSAFYGITNYLTEGMWNACSDEKHVKKLINTLKEKKQESINFSIESKALQEDAYRQIDLRIDELEKYLMGIHYIGEIPQFAQDRILSYGERLSSLMLTLTLQAEGIDAEEALPERIGLFTYGGYTNASVNFEKSTPSIKRALRKKKIYIIPGFYGISEDNKVTLLGRGGSDYSAAAIARAVSAESLDVWKDVNGYMSADPKIITKAKRVENLNYRQAAELSYFGAHILHPRTVEPLIEKEIPIKLFNIESDELSLKPLTIIGPDKDNKPTVKSVTYSDDDAILKIQGPGVGIKPGILGKITTALDNSNVNIKSVVTSQTVINIYLESSDLELAVKAVKKLKLPSILKLIPIKDISIIALVGQNLMNQEGLVDKFMTPLSRKGISVTMAALGASDGTAYFIVKHSDRDRAIQEIHKSFFEKSK